MFKGAYRVGKVALQRVTVLPEVPTAGYELQNFSRPIYVETGTCDSAAPLDATDAGNCPNTTILTVRTNSTNIESWG